MTNYLNLWALQGEEVSIAVDGLYQFWGATTHITRYGSAAVMVSQSEYDTSAEQWKERRELLLVDLETQVVMSRKAMALNQWLVPTGDGAAEYVLGTLSGTTLSLQAHDLMPGSSSFSEPVGVSVQLGVSSALADALAQFWTNLYVASGGGAASQSSSNYLLVDTPGGQDQNMITIHPVIGNVVEEPLETWVGWLSEFFVSGEELWLSVWNGSNSEFHAFAPSSQELRPMTSNVFFEGRDIALDVWSVVRIENVLVELRALGLGIPDEAEIWTDMDWAVESLPDGSLLVRAEIFPPNSPLSYEHWILLDAQGSLIAHKAFASGSGPLMRSIDDGEDGAIYFQQIHATGRFPELLQAANEAITVHRIAADSVTIESLLALGSDVETMAGQDAAPVVASYAQESLSQGRFSDANPLSAGGLLVLDGYVPLDESGRALAVGELVNLQTDQDQNGLIAVTRAVDTGGVQTDSVLLPGEIEDLFFEPAFLPDTLLARVQTTVGTIAVRYELQSNLISRFDEGLLSMLLDGQTEASFYLAFEDGVGQSVTFSPATLDGKLAGVAPIFCLTAEPLVVASSTDFAVVRFEYLATDGTSGSILARLEPDLTGWIIADALPIEAQIVELDPTFSPAGVLEAVDVVLMKIDNTELHVSAVQVRDGVVMAPEGIGTLPLKSSLDTLKLSPYASIRAEFGPEGASLEGSNGEQTFNIAVVLRTEDPQVPAGQAAVEYRSLMFAVTETAEGDIVSVAAVGDTLGLRSLPAYQQSGIVGYEAAGLFDTTPNSVVFTGVNGEVVQATVDRAALTAGLAAIDPGLSLAVLSPRVLEYNPDTQTFIFALREFTDTSFLQQTGRTFLVRLGWDGSNAALAHVDTVLLPTRFSGSFDGVRFVPSEHDGSLYLALGYEMQGNFDPARAFKVDYATITPEVIELSDPRLFLTVEADYLEPGLPERSGTDGNDSLTAMPGGEALFGLSGADTLIGSASDDYLDGGPGDDRIRGGQGADTIYGAQGTDRIGYASPADLIGDTVSGTGTVYFGGDPELGGDPSTVDRIQVFGPGSYHFATASSISYIDRIDIAADTGWFDVRLTSEMVASADGNGNGSYGDIHVVGYGLATGWPATTAQLFLDASALTGGQSVVVRGQEGSGVDGALAFGGLSGDDVITGGSGADWIHSGAGNDWILGGGGDDSLFGGEGDDLLQDDEGSNLLDGGPGNDVLSVGGVLGATLTGGAGSDRFVLTAQQYLTLLEGPRDIENTDGSTTVLTPDPVVITDFVAGVGGDVLDVVGLFQGTGVIYDGRNPFETGLLVLDQAGTDTVLSLDADGAEGSGSAPVPIAVLRAVKADSLVTANFYQLDLDPPDFVSGTTIAVGENILPGSVVYTADAMDANPLRYSLTGTEALAFAINPDTGEVTINASPNFETKSAYSFTVLATDTAGNFSERAVSLTIGDVNEVGVLNDATAQTIASVIATHAESLGFDLQAFNDLSSRKASALADFLANRPAAGFANESAAKLVFDGVVAANAASEATLAAANAMNATDPVASVANLIAAENAMLATFQSLAASNVTTLSGYPVLVLLGPFSTAITNLAKLQDTGQAAFVDSVLASKGTSYTGLTTLANASSVAYQKGVFADSGPLGVQLVADTGAFPDDGVTQDGTVSFSNLSSGANVQYSTDGGLTWTTLTSGSEFELQEAAYLAEQVQVRQSYSVLQLGKPAVQVASEVVKLGAVTIDSTAPSLSVGLSDAVITKDETATVTFTFSEVPKGFDSADVQAANGELSNLQVKADSGGLIYTATYTPVAGVADNANVITVGTGWTDSAGNAPGDSTTSVNYSVDTVAPTELSDLTGRVLTRKGLALPDFEAKLTLSTLDQMGLALVQETVESDGSRTLHFALSVDSGDQAFGAFDLALRTEVGVELLGLTLGEAFAGWQSLENQVDAQQLVMGAFSTALDSSNYASGEVALGEIAVRVAPDHAGPVRINVEELALGTALAQSGVLRYERVEDLDTGAFAFLDLEDGQIDLSFVGSTSSIGRSISAQDALEALKLAVRAPSQYSDAFGLIAADYNQDGKVSAQDALEILKAAVRLPTAIQPQWVFLSDEADLSAVSRTNTGYKAGLALDSLSVSANHDFTAVLLGDVNDSLVFV